MLRSAKKNTCGAPSTPNTCGSETKTLPSCGAVKTSCSAVKNSCHSIVKENSKIQNALRFALTLFKKIIPYVLLGAVISGISAAYLSADIVEKYAGGDNIFSILIASIIGVPLYLRIEMAIPLLKVLIIKGMGIGPAMALVIGGTGASLPEIALVSSVLKPKAVIAFVLIILNTAMIGGLLFQYVI